ncbi:homoserine O-acetyltransferase/O-succinyltransferase family protein [Azospirillum sp. B510]|uniref:homoserine O-acetyltransferase/O-succinyltransferase family protein n=1 Tax=Azospirillum sp. (strain B510) TaxID=137722 RepID=UPI0002FE96AE|nr:homoserine O-succinyltransferase [Azospirillum sp. B510]
MTIASPNPPARLAIINLMPQAEVYFGYMEQVLPPGTEIDWIRVRNHPYRSSDPEILARTHRFYDETDIDACDALLLTGAAMDINPVFEEASYWEEIVETLRDASARVGSIAGVCWGAQVVGRVFYDIEKQHFPEKVSGVYEMTNLRPDHPLMRGLDDRYFLPQSRYAQLEPKAFARAVEAGRLVPLDWCAASGHTTVVSADGRHVMLQGHQDYPTERLAEEYRSALSKGKDATSPVGYDVENPVNRWRANSRAFISSWLLSATRIKRGMRKAAQTRLDTGASA